jgi:cyclopropane fatty-acyl-phospholipid synthase-like methyltransferase
VRDLILNDLVNIWQGRDPKDLKVLEIGCGAGRVTRALAGFFGEIHAVDVSGEMVNLAKNAVRDLPNAHIYQNNGKDLSVVGEQLFDFAFSMCVFHHIPSKAIIESYISEVGKRLRARHRSFRAATVRERRARRKNIGCDGESRL